MKSRHNTRQYQPIVNTTDDTSDALLRARTLAPPVCAAADSPTANSGRGMMNARRSISGRWCSMAILIVFAAILAVSILPVCTAADWESWSGNRSIYINNTGGSAITDYQINVSLSPGINATSLRVVNVTASATVYHWNEIVVDGNVTELWFNAPHIPAGWCNGTYLIYYGNDTISSTSNYTNTFTKSYNTTGLVLELHMDEGSGNTGAVDSSGFGNNGTLTNMNTTGNATSGWQVTDGGQRDNRSDMVFSTGSHLQFDGVDDYVDCGNDASLDITDAITISAWVKCHTTTYAYDRIVSKGLWGPYNVFTDDTDKIYFRVGSNTTLPSSSLGKNTWRYVTATYDKDAGGNNQKLYIDGVLDKSRITSGKMSVVPNDVMLGGTGTDKWFNGSIDEVRIYNRALFEDEIYRQYIRSKYAADAPTAVLGAADAPTVSGVSSTTGNGSYKEGATIAVTVTFSEAVTVTGTPQITLKTGDTNQTANYYSGSPGTVLTFNYIVQAGDTSSDLDYTANNALALNGGTIKNAGNDATLTLANPGAANSLGANKAIVIDTTAPTFTVTAVSPDSGNTAKVGQDVVVTVTAGGSEIGLTASGTPTVNGVNAVFAEVGPADGNYTITYTVVEGNNDILDSDDLPVSIILKDAAGNPGTAITTIAVGTSPGIDANTPTFAVTAVSPDSGNTAKVGQDVVVTVTAGGSEIGLTASGTPTVNGVNAVFAEVGPADGNYTITYTVVEGNNDILDSDDLPVSIILKDAAGNPGTAITTIAVGTSPGIDANTPTFAVTAVSPDSGNTAKVGQDVVVTVTAGGSEIGLTASGTPTVNGVNAVFAEVGPADGNYTITYTVVEGNNDILDSDDLPVSIILKDAAGNPGTAITTIAVGTSPGIDANTPTFAVTAVSPDSGNTAKVGQDVVVTVTAGGSEIGLTASGTPTVNGVNAVFAEVGPADGNYTITYTVVEGNNDILDSDDLPVSIILKDAAGNPGTAITTIAVGTSPGIDANTPTFAVTAVSPDSGNTAKVGQDVVVTVTAGGSEIGLTASGTPTVNGVNAVFAEVGPADGNYTITYTVVEGNNDILDSDDLPVSIILKDAAGNPGTAITTIAVGTSPGIDANTPTLSSASRVDDTQINVTMSEAVTDLGGDGGFTVAETGDPGTIYTVSEIDVGGSAEFVILTVEDMAESGAEGVDVTYNASDPNGTITDIAGNDLATNTTGVTVAAWDTEAPTVSGVSSTTGNGSYKAGDSIAVTVTFSEVVTVTGIPQITLETGDTDRDVNCTSGTGTTVLTFNYIVQAGDTSSDLDYTATNALALNGGTIKNAAGNDATLTLAAPSTANSLGANKAIVIDTTAPTLNIWTLDIGAKTATLTFNESVNASTLDVTAVTIQDAATATTSYPLTDSTTASSNGASIVIALSATDFNAIIADSGLAVNNETSWMTITAAAIDDVAGNEVTAITDGNGLQATTYTAGTLDHINVTPTSASLNTTGDNETTFTATAKDRYGNNKSATFTWYTTPSGIGTLNDTTGSVVNFTALHAGHTEIYAVNDDISSNKVWVTVNAATNTTEVEGGNATATSGDSTAIVNLTNTTVSGTINFTEMGDPVNSSAAGGSTAGLGTNVLIKGVDVNVSINITHAMTDDASGNSYVYIQIDYNQSHIDGLGIDENTLHIYKWVTSSSSWVKLVEGSPSYCVANGRNTTANYVYANVTECSILGLGGSAPSDGNGGSSSTGGGSGTYPPGWFGTPTPTVTATKAPAATTTATDAPSGERVTPTPAKRPDVTKTTTPTATETAKTDTPGLTAVFAIAGLLAVAYAMMRRRS